MRFQNNYFCERFCFIAIYPDFNTHLFGHRAAFFSCKKVTAVAPTLKSEGARTSMILSKTLTLYAHYECVYTLSFVN